MNAGHINGSDTDALGSSKGVKGFTPRFAYSAATGQVSPEAEGSGSVSDSDEPKGSMPRNAPRVRRVRQGHKAGTLPVEKYWVDGVPSKERGVHSFTAKAEKCDAIFRTNISREYPFWAECKDTASKKGIFDRFFRFLTSPKIKGVLSDGGLLLLANADMANNLLALWFCLVYGEYAGYSTVWTPLEVMDAYKSDDLFAVSTAPAVLIIYVSTTDLDGSSAARRTHFLNNLASVVSARKGKPTIICRDNGGFYPNTSTFKAISDTFQQAITLN